jgi:hypothetical protein
MADRKVPASTPVLRGPGDIFNAFKGLVLFRADDLRAKGAAVVSWSISGINAEARAHGVKFDQVKDALRPKLFKALRALPGVAVEIIDSREQAAKLTLLPGAAGRNNGTRKASSPPKGSATATATVAATRRNKTPSPPKATVGATAAATAAVAPFHCNSSSSAMAEAREAVVEAVSAAVGGAGARPGKPKTAAQVMKGLLNKLTDANFESIRDQILMLSPANKAEYEAMIESLHDALLDDRAYHPQFIEMLRRMTVRHTTHPYPSPPCAALNNCLLSTFAKGPEGVQMAVDMEEGKLNEKNDTLDTQKKRKTLRYESLTLLLGYLLREEMLSLADFVKAFKMFKVDEDDDYRLQDVNVQGMMFLLIRAGPRLAVLPEAGEFYRAALETTASIAKDYPRSNIRTMAQLVLASKDAGWKTTEGAKWTIGAPKDGIAVRAVVKALAPEGLGPDPLELARRFPLVVKLDAIAKGVHAVEIHGKKMRERCAASGKTEKEVLAAVFELVKNSAHFERAADPRGAPAGFLMAIQGRKHP